MAFGLLERMTESNLVDIINAVRNKEDAEEIVNDLDEAFGDEFIKDVWYALINLEKPKDVISKARFRTMGVYVDSKNDALSRIGEYAAFKAECYTANGR